MDANWNWFIDNMAVRTALIVTGFVVWLGGTLALLSF